MENASKALLIAGGVLLAILLTTLFRYSWGLFSEYMSSSDKLADIEDTSKFNQQFTNYDRDDVEGYELISLANQIIDYNQRKSTEGRNDEKYSPISFSIKLVTTRVTENDININFAADGEHRYLINRQIYNLTDFNSTIISVARNIENTFGGVEATTKIAKNIDSIFLSSGDNLDKWKKAAEKFNIYSQKAKITVTSSSTEATIARDINRYKDDIIKYYEYSNLKKAIFKCTNIEYNNNTGRVSKIEFEFTGALH